MSHKYWKRFRKNTPRDPRYESFEAFFEAEFKRLVRLLIHRGARPDEAEDAAATAMAAASTKTNDIDNLASWVHVVAKHEWLKARERQERERRFTRENPPAPQHEDQYPSDDEHVQLALACLPDMQRNVMELYLEGYTAGEIAQRLDASPATVRSNLRHARQKLEWDLSQPAGNE